MPGEWLLAIARVVFDEVVQKAVVHQAVADMREEWLDAESNALGRVLARGRGYVAFWTLVAMAPFVFKSRDRRWFPWNVELSWARPFRLPAALAIVGLAAGYMYARAQPVLYRATAVVQVVPPRVGPIGADAARLMRQLTTEDRVRLANWAINSRARFERYIERDHLFQAELARMPLVNVVNLMRERIAITARDGASSTSNGSIVVSFTGADPQEVQKTTQSLATLVIEESLRHRTATAEHTDYLIKRYLASVEAELAEAQKQFEDAHARDRIRGLKVETLQREYERLLNVRAEYRLASEMESRKLATLLQFAEKPRLPTAPLGPSRVQMSLVGGAIGIAAALVFSICSSAAGWLGWSRRLAPVRLN